jgi:hypothetical protein
MYFVCESLTETPPPTSLMARFTDMLTLQSFNAMSQLPHAARLRKSSEGVQFTVAVVGFDLMSKFSFCKQPSLD